MPAAHPTPTPLHAALPAAPPGVFLPDGICSAHPRLLTNYIIICLFTGPAFPVAFLVSYFRYLTLRYRFDADGVTMTVGILFRREVALTYRRIQDIHVTRGIIQRWLGLAKVACQTASGSSSPELVIEGLLDYEAVRDFLYRQMRGAKDGTPAVPDALAVGKPGPSSGAHPPSADAGPPDEALDLLADIRDGIAGLTREVKGLRAEAADRPSAGPGEPPRE